MIFLFFFFFALLTVMQLDNTPSQIQLLGEKRLVQTVVFMISWSRFSAPLLASLFLYVSPSVVSMSFVLSSVLSPLSDLLSLCLVQLRQLNQPRQAG